jgi:hypothetical protein
MTLLMVWASLLLVANALGQSGYLTGAPVPGWLGLATDAGRDAVVPGAGCDSAAPGVNVVVLDPDHVQVVDPLAGLQPGTCALARRQHMSDSPCARNAAGLCDVAFD